MNKELINKYKIEFDHWLAGGDLLYTTNYDVTTFQWNPWRSKDNDEADMWNAIDIDKIVINDEYSTYRKALAEGKTIEYTDLRNYPNVGGWGTMRQIDHFNRGVEYYRIKPEGYTFTEGTWVLVGNNTKPVQYTTEQYPRNSGLAIKEWKPSRGEWCLFWNSEHSVRPKLAQYITTNDYGHVTSQYNYNTFDYCMPFTGTLPEYLKDS